VGWRVGAVGAGGVGLAGGAAGVGGCALWVGLVCAGGARPWFVAGPLYRSERRLWGGGLIAGSRPSLCARRLEAGAAPGGRGRGCGVGRSLVASSQWSPGELARQRGSRWRLRCLRARPVGGRERPWASPLHGPAEVGDTGLLAVLVPLRGWRSAATGRRWWWAASTSSRRAWAEPAVVGEPWRRRSPEERSAGHRSELGRRPRGVSSASPPRRPIQPRAGGERDGVGGQLVAQAEPRGPARRRGSVTKRPHTGRFVAHPPGTGRSGSPASQPRRRQLPHALLLGRRHPHQHKLPRGQQPPSTARRACRPARPNAYPRAPPAPSAVRPRPKPQPTAPFAPHPDRPPATHPNSHRTAHTV
jgi:hypothetical protein